MSKNYSSQGKKKHKSAVSLAQGNLPAGAEGGEGRGQDTSNGRPDHTDEGLLTEGTAEGASAGASSPQPQAPEIRDAASNRHEPGIVQKGTRSPGPI
jgi:hypothetical protein